LTYKSLTNEYDNQVVPLLHRMCNLEDLTLYIDIKKRNRIVDGIQLENDIFTHLSKLKRFVFYICTGTDLPVISLSSDDIQRTFSNLKFGQIGCGMNYIDQHYVRYHVFSLPFMFDCIEHIGNSFTNVIYKNVTFLCVHDTIPFEHEFFVRLARCFPLLEYLMIINLKAQSTDSAKPEYDNTNGSLEVVEYLHLTGLHLDRVHINYVEQMLNESKTRLPCLTELDIDYSQLKTVTNNFTRDATRLNCTNVEELNFHNLNSLDTNMNDYSTEGQSKDFYAYFPSLKL
jgi:hypothetical protein